MKRLEIECIANFNYASTTLKSISLHNLLFLAKYLTKNYVHLDRQIMPLPAE